MGFDGRAEVCQLRKTGEYFSPGGGKSLWKGLEFDQERPQHSRTVRGRATPGWSGAGLVRIRMNFHSSRRPGS